MLRLIIIIIVIIVIIILLALVTLPTLFDLNTLDTLSSNKIIQHVNGDYIVDIVLLPPFVIDSGTNFSFLSVLRYIPWVRRVHIFDENIPSLPSTESKIMYFNQSLLHYSITTPYLSEMFLVLEPEFVVTNYIFPWQFFIRSSPVIRDCNIGIHPFTRHIFNECIYSQSNLPNFAAMKLYAVNQGKSLKTILYKNNADHIIPPCSALPITSTKHAKHIPVDLRSLFQYEEPIKMHDQDIVIVVINQNWEDLFFCPPLQFQHCTQLWVCPLTKNTSKRLSFIHRMKVTKNMYIELASKDTEKNCVRVMRNLKGGRMRGVKCVCSHKANKIGNRLAQIYDLPLEILISTTTQKNEIERLKML